MSAFATSYLTYRYRVKDGLACKHLSRMSKAVNFVWNHCGDVQEQARKWGKRWPTEFDLIKLTAGAGRDLDLAAKTVESVCSEFVKARSKAKRRPRWRSAKRSLGWVPFSRAWENIRIVGDAVVFRKRSYRLWLHRPLTGVLKCGSFSQDADGLWYINLVCEVQNDRSGLSGEVGIDLGLKALASMSNGKTIENPRYVRAHAERLAKAQRAGRMIWHGLH